MKKAMALLLGGAVVSGLHGMDEKETLNRATSTYNGDKSIEKVYGVPGVLCPRATTLFDTLATRELSDDQGDACDKKMCLVADCRRTHCGLDICAIVATGLLETVGYAFQIAAEDMVKPLARSVCQFTFVKKQSEFDHAAIEERSL